MRHLRIRYFAAVLLAAALFLVPVSCGYHVGGQADLVPRSIHTIAIPAFSTFTARYRLVDELPQQIGREFIARTRFHIVQNPNDADAVLSGSIFAVQAYPAVLDPTSGKATSIQVTVNLTVTLTEEKTGRVLYARPMSVSQRYQIAVDPHQFFNESGPALDRLSQDVAHNIVSAVVENF